MDVSKKSLHNREELFKNEYASLANSFLDYNYKLNFVFKRTKRKCINDYVVIELYPQDITREDAIRSKRILVRVFKVFLFNQDKKQLITYNKKRINRYLNKLLKKTSNSNSLLNTFYIRKLHLINCMRNYSIANDYLTKDYSHLLLFLFIIIMLIIALIGAFISISGERNLGFYI